MRTQRKQKKQVCFSVVNICIHCPNTNVRETLDRAVYMYTTGSRILFIAKNRVTYSCMYALHISVFYAFFILQNKVIFTFSFIFDLEVQS